MDMDMTRLRMIPANHVTGQRAVASDRVRLCVRDVGADDGRHDRGLGAPMILMYARVGRHWKAQGKPFAATGWFAAGYLLAGFRWRPHFSMGDRARSLAGFADDDRQQPARRDRTDRGGS